MATQILLTLEDKINKKLEKYCGDNKMSKNNAINILLDVGLERKKMTSVQKKSKRRIFDPVFRRSLYKN